MQTIIDMTNSRNDIIDKTRFPSNRVESNGVATGFCNEESHRLTISAHFPVKNIQTESHKRSFFLMIFFFLFFFFISYALPRMSKKFLGISLGFPMNVVGCS